MDLQAKLHDLTTNPPDPREDEFTKTVERYTAAIPSSAFLTVALAAMGVSLVAQLSGGADPNGMGDTFSGGRKYRKRALADLSEAFGAEFVVGLADQKPGTWAIRRSRHGLHVIRVDAKAAAEAASFEAMRGEIEMAYDEKRKDERLAAAIADLRKKYAAE